MERVFRRMTKVLGTTKALAVAALTFSMLMPGRVTAKPVTLSYTPTLYSTQIIIAREKNFFAKYQIELDPKLFSAGRLTLDALIAGGSEFAATAETPMTAAVMAGQPIAILARLATATPNTLVRVDSKIDSPKDLRGKKIGITAGTGSEVYTYTLLEKAGLKPSDVSYVSLRPEDMPGALLNHSVDAISTWQPFISNAQKLLGANAKMLETSGTYSETWNLVVAPKYLEKNAETAENMLKALLDAEDFIEKHPAEAKEIVSRVIGIDKASVDSSWGNFHYKIAVDPAIVGVLDAHSRWRLATGNHPPNVTRIPDFKKDIFSGPLKAASSSRVSPGF